MHLLAHRRLQLRSFLAPSEARSSLRAIPLGLSLLCTAAVGCTRSEVSLGSGQETTAVGSELICGDGTRTGIIVASRQDQLEALRGCTEINVDLELVGFPGMDLSPLSELRIVRGDLLVGARGNITGSPVGTISSLAGLEALEQVNNLSLAHLTTADLSALARLRSIRRDPLGPQEEGGRLSIYDCSVLHDLRGLDSLAEFAELSTQANAQLESLAGLQVPSTLRSVSLVDEPNLKDLGALAPLEEVGELALDGTAVANLDALQLSSADRIFLRGNASLEQVDGLSSLRNLRELDVLDNDRLQELPGFNEVQGVEFVSVVDNAELRSVPSFQSSLGATAASFYFSRQPEGLVRGQTYYGFNLFEVANNPKLLRITPMGASYTSRQVVIHDNASLIEIDFGAVNNLSLLRIHDNATLTRIGLEQGALVTDLLVQNNPLLSVAPFASVHTLFLTVSGNLDAP
ncbi:MAG: hypothetical protein RL685_1876 [Pseudomonadota bacterium]|jgi:hypothetical protein